MAEFSCYKCKSMKIILAYNADSMYKVKLYIITCGVNHTELYSTMC